MAPMPYAWKDPLQHPGTLSAIDDITAIPSVSFIKDYNPRLFTTDALDTCTPPSFLPNPIDAPRCLGHGSSRLCSASSLLVLSVTRSSQVN